MEARDDWKRGLSGSEREGRVLEARDKGMRGRGESFRSEG